MHTSLARATGLLTQHNEIKVERKWAATRRKVTHIIAQTTRDILIIPKKITSALLRKANQKIICYNFSPSFVSMQDKLTWHSLKEELLKGSSGLN